MNIKRIIEQLKRVYAPINHGRKIYKKICKKYGKDICVCISQHPALGDAFLTGMYLEETNKCKYIVTTVGEGAAEVYEMFGVENIEILSQIETDNFIRFCEFMSISQDKIHVLHHQALAWNTGIVWNFQGVHNINFLQLLENVVFDHADIAKRKYPKITVNSGKEKKWSEMGIKKEESIILFPYANTLYAPPIWFWERLVQNLKHITENIYTYVSKDEVPILGTKAISEEIKYITPLVEYAGKVIGVRNGIMDIIGNSSAKKIILYPDFGTDDWIKGNSIDYWSLVKFQLANNVVELEWNEENLLEILGEICQE